MTHSVIRLLLVLAVAASTGSLPIFAQSGRQRDAVEQDRRRAEGPNAHGTVSGDAPMRLDEPRIQPLVEAEWNDQQRELLEPLARDGRLYNVFRTWRSTPTSAAIY